MAPKTPALIVDGLWNCLCPIFPRRAFSVASKKRRIPQRCIPTRRQFPVWHTASAQAWPLPYQSRQHGTSSALGAPLMIEDMPSFSQERGANGARAEGGQSEDSNEAEAQLLARLHHYAQEADKPKVQELILILVKDFGQVPDTIHYEALILAEADPTHGSAAEIERLLKRLDIDGILPDSAVYHAALKALAIHPNYVLREKVLAEMERRWFDLSESGWHSVIAALFRERQIELALERLSKMQATGYEPKPWLLHLAIAMCLSVDAFPEALSLLKLRTQSTEPIPSALWAECLQKAAHDFCHPLVDFIWRRAVEASYLNPSSGTCVAVLDTAARYGNFRLATDVFRVLEARASPLQPHHYEALMEAYLNAGDLPAAMSVLGLMKTSGHTLDAGACRGLVQFLVDNASTRVPHCLALLAEPLPRIPIAAPQRGLHKSASDLFPATAVVLTACIEALVRVPALDAARSLMEDWAGYCPHEKPGLAVYNSLLLGAMRLEDGPRQRELAAEWLAAMDECGLEPDETTLERLLVVNLGPKGILADIEGLLGALACFEKLKDQDVNVPLGVRSFLISKLVRAGHVTAAEHVSRMWGVDLKIKETSIDATAEDMRRTGEIVRVEDGEGGRKWIVDKPPQMFRKHLSHVEIVRKHLNYAERK